MTGLYRPVNIGNTLRIPGNLFLGPVAGYTDRAFRSICRSAGADFSYTELISAEALARHTGPVERSKTWPLIRPGEGEGPYGVQLFSGNPDALYRAVLMLEAVQPSLVDINCGCPVPKVVKAGAGSALMRDPLLLGRIVKAAVRASQAALGGVPITVKLRSGWDGDSINYREAACAAVEAGAALVALHPRTRAQGYSGSSDWSHIADLAARLAVPVAGSGDLASPACGERMLRETGCAAALFARGALGNPFIFAETRSLLLGEPYNPPQNEERIALAFRHLQLLAGDRGEYAACREMRKQFCAYTRGIPGGARLRDALVHAASIEEYRAVFHPLATT
ncbi:MAG: tRNA dihydrouridine synthase DusB [Treponema sp.]|jgi:nifR3 family TIM-barrel protein|nr:tRNA dihydrouridine synthase DusB [Treponema sp.]